MAHSGYEDRKGPKDLPGFRGHKAHRVQRDLLGPRAPKVSPALPSQVQQGLKARQGPPLLRVLRARRAHKVRRGHRALLARPVPLVQSG